MPQEKAARHALTLASSIDEVKEIRDKAEALRLYIRQAEGSLEMQNRCAELKVRAERRAGELLAEMPKNAGGNPNLLHDETGSPPKLDDLSISRVQSHRWQAIASLPEESFEGHIHATLDMIQQGGHRGPRVEVLKTSISVNQRAGATVTDS